VVDTFPALWLTVLFLLPGALFTWAREQQTGRWGIGLSDRVLRFLAASTVVHGLLLPLSYWLYARFVVTGELGKGAALPWWSWPLLLLYVVPPVLLGRALGVGIGLGDRWALWVAGHHPAPRAWDHLFGRAHLGGWVVLRLKDGTWLAGLYSRSIGSVERSYASRYPETQELYLAETAAVDDRGRLLSGSDGQPVLLGRGVLLRWEEASYLEFSPIRTTPPRRERR
jgi:hypothetical protein